MIIDVHHYNNISLEFFSRKQFVLYTMTTSQIIVISSKFFITVSEVCGSQSQKMILASISDNNVLKEKLKDQTSGRARVKAALRSETQDFSRTLPLNKSAPIIISPQRGLLKMQISGPGHLILVLVT